MTPARSQLPERLVVQPLGSIGDAATNTTLAVGPGFKYHSPPGSDERLAEIVEHAAFSVECVRRYNLHPRLVAALEEIAKGRCLCAGCYFPICKGCPACVARSAMEARE